MFGIAAEAATVNLSRPVHLAALLIISSFAAGADFDPYETSIAEVHEAMAAELERATDAQAELVDQALDLARELEAVRGLAAASLAKGRRLIAEGDADGAAPYLREAAEIVDWGAG